MSDQRDQRDLSLRLYDILEMVGASEEIRRFHQRTAITEEILEGSYNYTGKLKQIYRCGSSFEGTVTPDIASDIDTIFCNSRQFVVPDRFKAGPGMFLHIVREEWTRPGYVKLQYIRDGRPLTSHDVKVNENWVFDREGRTCAKRLGLDLSEGNRHGPAEMLFDEWGRHYGDKVDAYRCKGIPLFATEWITRTRRFAWPSSQLISEIKMLGCLFVGVGHFTSPEKELEFRISFSLQERRLMMSLNPVQHKVYILMKMIKKNILETFLNEESLSSYHCKTCVFYMAETTPASMWVPENLISCLLQCLALLLKWVRERFCPSYFLKDQNLFDKEGFLEQFDPLERMIDKMLKTGSKFLYLIQSERVGEMLRDEGELKLYKPDLDAKLGKYVGDIKFCTIRYIIRTCRDSLLKALKRSEQETLKFYLTELEKAHNTNVEGYTEEYAKEASRYRLPWLHLQIGLELATRAVTCPDRHESKELMKKVDHHMQQARNIDLVNVRLVKATILLRLEKLNDSFLLLQEVEKNWTYDVYTFCPCTIRASKLITHNDHQKREQFSKRKDLSVTEILRQYTAFCVMFESSQMELVPTALRYEMCRSFGMSPVSRQLVLDDWFDLVVVDAEIYLYFLKYLVCSKLNSEPHMQIAIDNIVSLIDDDDGKLGHKETAYNILGWIYLQENRVADAMRCFNLSWQIRPDHNAAKFHVLELCFRLLAARSRQQDNLP